MEPIYRQSFTLGDGDADRFCRLRPSRLLYYVQEVSGMHSSLLSWDYARLADKRLFWAATRHRAQIERLPQLGETITLETWPMPTTRVAYPRSTVAYDADGHVCFRTVTLWVLMNLDTRAMILPGKSGVTVAGTLRGSELALPGSLIPKPFAAACERHVRYTDLDRNGHMNNTRYLDWVDDLLPSAFHETHTPREFTVCYLSEAREGDCLSLGYELTDGPSLQLSATRTGDVPARVFGAQMAFAESVL